MACNSKQSRDANSFDEKGKWSALIGINYQVKLCTYILCKGLTLYENLQVGTEIKAAEKFDDIVIKLTNDLNDNNFIIIQSKHTTKKDDNIENINIRDLLSNDDGDYGLFKYYNSYHKAKKHDLFKNNNIKYAFLYTNKNFDLDKKIPEINKHWSKLKTIGNIVEEIQPDNHNELNLFPVENGKFYRFKIDILRPVLKRVIIENEYKKIAISLLNTRSGDKEILKKYCHILVKEVIDKKTGKLKKDFVIGKLSDSEELKTFRRVLDSVLKLRNRDLKNFENWETRFDSIITLAKSNDQSNVNQYWPIIPVIEDKDIDEFLQKIIFATGQPGEENFEEYILKVLKNHFVNKNIYNDILLEMNNRTKGDSLVFPDQFITSEAAKEFLTKADQKNNEDVYKGPIIGYKKKLEEDFSYIKDNEMVESLKKILGSDIRVLHVSSLYEILTTIKIYTSLEILEKQYIFDQLSSLVKSATEYSIKAFERKLCNHSLLILECDIEEKNYKIIDKIFEILEKGVNKKVILISKKNNQFVKKFMNKFTIRTQYETIEDKGYCIAPEKHFLELSKIKFQEDFIELNKIFEESSQLLKDGHVLTKLICNEEIVIGNLYTESKNTEEYYIDRKFMIELIIDDDTVVLISKYNEETLKKINVVEEIKQIVEEVEKEEEEILREEYLFFEEAREKHKNKKICLLHQKNDSFILIKKTRNFREELNQLKNKIEKAMKNQIVLVTAPAGMGKSCVLSNLTRKIKKSYPNLWVYKIELNTLTNELYSMNVNELDKKKMIEFLECALKLKHETEKKLFKEYLKKHKIILLIDGMDEISPNYDDLVIKLIKTFKDVSRPYRLFISTRSEESILKNINEEFEEFRCEIQPFTGDEQRDFFRKIWEIEISNVNEFNAFNKFFEVLFGHFRNIIVYDLNEFLGIPLHTMMIAAIFKEEFKTFLNSGSHEVGDEVQKKMNNILKVSELYKEFVRVKFYEIFFEEKQEMDLTKPSLQNIADTQYKNLIQELMLLSLKSFFEDDEIEQLLLKSELDVLKRCENDMKEIRQRAGIIVRIIDNKPFFIHKTFAEYFVAFFVIKTFIENNEQEQKEKVLLFFLNSVFPEKGTICSFINDMYCNEINDVIKKCSKVEQVVRNLLPNMLFYVIQKKWQNIVRILVENGFDMNYKSKGKITILNFPEITENGILKLILEGFKDKPDNLRRLLHKKGPSDHITLFFVVVSWKNIDDVEMLIGKLRDLKILNEVITFENENRQNILHYIAEIENDRIFEFILDTFFDNTEEPAAIIQKTDIFGMTPLLRLVRKSKSVNYCKIFVNKLCQYEILKQEIIVRCPNGENVLHHVINNENKNIFEFIFNLLKENVANFTSMIRKPDVRGKTLLLKAARKLNDINYFELLLQKLEEYKILNEEIMTEDYVGSNIFHFIVCNENNDIFAKVLKMIDEESLQKMIRKKNNFGITPLFCVVQKCKNLDKCKSMINTLRKLNILNDEIMVEDHRGNNILYYAVDNENTKILEYILDILLTEYEANFLNMLQKRNNDNITPLLFAGIGREKSDNLIILINTLNQYNLLKDEMTVVDKDGNNILHYVVKNERYDDFKLVLCVMRKNSKQLRKKFKTMVGQKNNLGETPLLIVAALEDFSICAELLEVLRKLNILEEEMIVEDENGNNTLYRLVESERYTSFWYIINQLAGCIDLKKIITKKNKHGETLLMKATSNIWMEDDDSPTMESLIDMLNKLEKKDELLIEDKHGQNILHYAIKNGFENFKYIIEYIKKNYDGNFVEMVTKKNNKGITPLLTAAESCRNPNICNLLIEELQDILKNQIVVEDECGQNILHYVVKVENNSVFEIMLNAVKEHVNNFKSMVQKRNNKGATPLLIAVEKSNKLNCEMLIETLDHDEILKDEIIVEDKYKNNILHYAVKNKFDHDILILLAKTLDELKYVEMFRKKNKNHETPLLTAVSISDNVMICKIFVGWLNHLNIQVEIIAEDINRNNIFHLIANTGNIDYFLKALVIFDEYADNLIEKKNNFGNTPLSIIAKKGLIYENNKWKLFPGSIFLKSLEKYSNLSIYDFYNRNKNLYVE